MRDQVTRRKRSNKYRAKKKEIDGITFDSKAEGKYYVYLKALKQQGEISDFELQPRFLLQEGFTKNGQRFRPIHYTADFKLIYPDGRIEIVDVKGKKTRDFVIRQKLFEKKYPDLRIKLVKM